MKKASIYIIQILFICTSTVFSQSVQNGNSPCEEIGRRFSDSTELSWDYPGLDSVDYYCIGKYSAKKDISSNKHYFQIISLPEWVSPCIKCAFCKHGYEFQYLGDVSNSNMEAYALGYNEIADSCLLNKIGQEEFNRLKRLPDDLINPQSIIEAISMSLLDQKKRVIKKIKGNSLIMKFNFDPSQVSLPVKTSEIRLSINDSKYYNLDEISKKSWELKRSKYSKNRKLYEIKLSFDFSMVHNSKLCLCDCVNQLLTVKWSFPLKSWK